MISRRMFGLSGNGSRKRIGRVMLAATVLLAGAVTVIGLVGRTVQAGDAPAAAKEIEESP